MVRELEKKDVWDLWQRNIIDLVYKVSYKIAIWKKDLEKFHTQIVNLESTPPLIKRSTVQSNF